MGNLKEMMKAEKLRRQQLSKNISSHSEPKEDCCVDSKLSNNNVPFIDYAESDSEEQLVIDPKRPKLIEMAIESSESDVDFIVDENYNIVDHTSVPSKNMSSKLEDVNAAISDSFNSLYNNNQNLKPNSTGQPKKCLLGGYSDSENSDSEPSVNETKKLTNLFSTFVNDDELLMDEPIENNISNPIFLRVEKQSNPKLNLSPSKGEKEEEDELEEMIRKADEEEKKSRLQAFKEAIVTVEKDTIAEEQLSKRLVKKCEDLKKTILQQQKIASQKSLHKILQEKEDESMDEDEILDQIALKGWRTRSL